MVEVHLMGLVALAAVCAWNGAPFTEHVARAGLSGLDTEELLLAIPTVVLDVGWSLIANSGHA